MYNTTILDETIRKYPDDLSKQYKNNLLQPFWTSYTYTLQKQLDQLVLDRHTDGVRLEYDYTRMNELTDPSTTSMLFFEITVCFAWCVLFILTTLLAINSRGPNHIILRRLGVPTWLFLVCNYIYTFAACLASCLLSGVVWHYTAVLPFSGVTLGFAVVE